MKIRRSTLIASTIVVFLALTIPVLSRAVSVCSVLLDLTGGNSIFAPLCGWKLTIPTPTTINEYAICRTIASTNTKNIFVPLNSQPEWTDFVNNPPPSTTAGICAAGCAKMPVSILLTSNNFDPTTNTSNSDHTEYLYGQLLSGGPGGMGSTTLSFNWSTGSVMQSSPSSAANYDPDAGDSNYYHPGTGLSPFNISAVITFTDGTTDNLTNIAPPDGNWHQLPGDWSDVSQSSPINTCAQGYDVSSANTGAFTDNAIYNFSVTPQYPGEAPGTYIPMIRRFHTVSNCQNFVGATYAQIYPSGNLDYNTYINNPNLFYAQPTGGLVQGYGNPSQKLSQSPDISSWNIPLTSLSGNLIGEPIRLVTFNYTSTGTGSTCSTYLPINCQTDLIPTYLQFNYPITTSGNYASVVVTFSNGTTQTVSNFSTTTAWSTLPGDWSSTVLGNFGCLPGNCSTPATAASTHSSTYGVYLTHTAAVNAECVNANGSIDHKIETADYSFPLTASYGFTDYDANYEPFEPADVSPNAESSSFYSVSAPIVGFWGSYNLQVTANEGKSSGTGGYAGLEVIQSEYAWNLDDQINAPYNNKFNPEFAIAPPYSSYVTDTVVPLPPPPTTTSHIWTDNQYNTQEGYNQWFPVDDMMTEYCQAVTAGTKYANSLGYLVPPLYFATTPGYPTDTSVIDSNDSDYPNYSADSGTYYFTATNQNDTEGPSSKTIEYSCLDPIDFDPSPPN